jgi:hypothetical protein
LASPFSEQTLVPYSVPAGSPARLVAPRFAAVVVALGSTLVWGGIAAGLLLFIVADVRLLRWLLDLLDCLGG